MAAIAAVITGCFVAYFLSSGVVFCLIYRRRFPPRLASAMYEPLEAIARRSRFFGRWYTNFHWWMYRRLVDDYKTPTPPPPPSMPLR
jgi:hypothetical protein